MALVSDYAGGGIASLKLKYVSVVTSSAKAEFRWALLTFQCGELQLRVSDYAGGGIAGQSLFYGRN
jgi:hypothetical protein